MEKTVVALASSSDVDDILELEQACFGIDAFSRVQIAYLVKQSKGIFLLAKIEGELAGYLSFLTNDGTHNGRVYSIAVSPDYRGQGVAQLLIDEMFDYARGRQLKSIFLEVRVSNMFAIALYEKNGFVKRKLKEYYYDDGESAYSMMVSC
ncbi:MAG: ribosomal protein S18-alanine N-acetyltransferase [Mangrovibacterium sp.]